MRVLATLTAASALILAGAAFAQSPPPAPGAPPASGAPQDGNAARPGDADARGQRPRLSREDRGALVDARIAGIQAGLKLTPEQQRLFGPVEQALRAQARERAERMDERRGERGAQSLDLMQRLDRQAERTRERAESVQALAGAMRPFWASLNEDQKRLLPVLMRGGAGRGHDHHGGRYRHGGMPDGMHHGMPMGPRRS
ncbi:Spy/CpxP family protein refolding chaperone [Salinarimonas soli]|nr:Spy/CpxP family protein refolding chaperone [Salinarimonas soli]